MVIKHIPNIQRKIPHDVTFSSMMKMGLAHLSMIPVQSPNCCGSRRKLSDILHNSFSIWPDSITIVCVQSSSLRRGLGQDSELLMMISNSVILLILLLFHNGVAGVSPEHTDLLVDFIEPLKTWAYFFLYIVFLPPQAISCI